MSVRAVDWRLARQCRDRAASRKKDRLAYLLKPEVNKLLALESEDERRLAFLLLWSTGIRVTELIALRVADFKITRNIIELSVPSTGIHPKRTVYIQEAAYIKQIREFIHQLRLPALSRLFDTTRQTVTRWFNLAVDRLKKRNKRIPSDLTVSSLRHSFAMNWLIQGMPVHLLVQWMGFHHLPSAAHYLQYLSYEPKQLIKDVRFI